MVSASDCGAMRFGNANEPNAANDACRFGAKRHGCDRLWDIRCAAQRAASFDERAKKPAAASARFGA
jgi:hypothetical protein